MIGAGEHAQFVESLDLIRAAGTPFDPVGYRAGRQTPVFFGSAMTNFGLEPFLRALVELAPPPQPRLSDSGIVNPTDERFTGFVFKIQANMDPKHRDRIAFVRVCSGKFEAGMQVRHVRTGKMIRLASPQQFMARERSAVEEAWPGDVIGIMDRGNLRIGDSLSNDGDLEFADIPRFAPEHFARVVPKDAMRRKQFDTGLRELTEEGAAQVFYSESEAGPIPIVGAVGMLQFDVMQYRLEHEYGAPVKFERIPFRHPRWVTGPESEIDRVATQRGRMRLYDAKGNPLILFEDEWNVRWAQQNETKVEWLKVAP